MAMIETPIDLIETPRTARDSDRADLLADVLAHVRLSGALFLRGEYAAPWAFDSPESPDLVQLLAPGAERLIVFHSIRAGRAWVRAGNERVDAVAVAEHVEHPVGTSGSVIVAPGGSACAHAIPARRRFRR